MTKKRIGTKRKRVKKQMRRKTKKMRKTRKSMRGGNLTRAQFVEKISDCIPNNPTRFPDMPFSPTGYTENEDNWTKLAQNISENGPIEFNCHGKNALIYGDNSIHVDFNNNIKIGKLYGIIGESCPIILWRNGIQQTYEERPISVFGFGDSSGVTTSQNGPSYRTQ
jgi:hypothetical protein